MPPLATLQTLLANAKADYLTAMAAGLFSAASRYANEIASLEKDIVAATSRVHQAERREREWQQIAENDLAAT